MARRGIGGELPSPAAALEILGASFYLRFAGRAGRERMFASMSVRVRRYAENHSDSLRRVIRVEQRFEVPIDGSRVRGRMDLVARVQVAPAPDGIEIIDISGCTGRRQGSWG